MELSLGAEVTAGAGVALEVSAGEATLGAAAVTVPWDVAFAALPGALAACRLGLLSRVGAAAIVRRAGTTGIDPPGVTLLEREADEA